VEGRGGAAAHSEGSPKSLATFVFVQPHLRFGGAERQTVLVANELAARGHECHVILHQDDGGLSGELSAGVILHSLGHGSHAETLQVARNLRAVLRDIPPAFVIVKLWSSILACALVDRRLPQHVFNYCEDLDPTDHATYIRFGAFKQRLIGRIFRHRPILTANTHTVAESMAKVYSLGRVPDVVPSTVDAGAIASWVAQNALPERVASGPLAVVSVGSLIARKGLMATYQALAKLGSPVDWTVVGVGPLADELRAAAADNPLVALNLLGGMARPYAVMANADLVIHSALSEAWGIVLLEAMAAGTPVIAADAIGPAEMQEVLGMREEFLMLYETGSAEALAEAIQRRVEMGIAPTYDMSDYIAPFSVMRASDVWVERAAQFGR